MKDGASGPSTDSEDNADGPDGDSDGDDDGDMMGPADGDGPPDPQAHAELCEMQETLEDCDAVPSESYPWEAVDTWCVWETWVPVSFDGEGSCQFGNGTGMCDGEGAGEAARATDGQHETEGARAEGRTGNRPVARAAGAVAGGAGAIVEFLAAL